MNNTINDNVVDIVKKKRKRPDLTELQTPHTEPGEISKMLGQALTMSKWTPIDTNDAQQVIARIDQYHEFCFEHDIKPDMSGLALAIGVSRKTLWAWENGIESNKPQEVRNALKKGREINEYLMAQLMQNGRINPVTGIFLLKNNFSYADEQQIVITPNNPMNNGDPAQARSRYVQALPEDTEDTETE